MTAVVEHHAPPIHGPYASLDDAVAEAWHIYQAAAANREAISLAQILEGIEHGTLREVRVELGAYDRQVAAWLSTWEPEVVEVILGWIVRAHEAGQRSAPTAAGLSMHRCIGSGCANTALLPAGSSYLCSDHGGADAS